MRYYLLLFLVASIFVVATVSQVYHDLTVPHDTIELILDTIVIIILITVTIIFFIFAVGTYIEETSR